MTTIDNFRKMLLARLGVLSKHKSFLWIFLGLFLVLGLIFTQFFSISAYHDERHFLENIIYFSQTPFLTAIKDYPEVTPPLFYSSYAIWGKIGELNLPWLRSLSLLFSISSILILTRIFKWEFSDSGSWKFFLLILLFNPYFLGSSFLVYTDILAFFFLVLLIYGINRKILWLILIASMGGLLTRQYLVFASLAAGIWMMINYYRSRDSFYLIGSLVTLISTFPILWLFKIWGGFAPVSGLEKWNPGDGFAFHPGYFSGYIAVLPIYLCPLFLFKPLVLKRRQVFILIPALVWYLIFPVQASDVAKEQLGIETIGWMHKVLKMGLGDGLMLEIVLGTLFCLGAIWISQIIWVSGKDTGFGLFLKLAILAFLFIMPFSYQVWEKYLISLIPLILLLAAYSATERSPRSSIAQGQGE